MLQNTPKDIALEPDYWKGQWYEDIKSVVTMVAGEMRNHGVDPTLIQAEDAWKHYYERTLASLRARGVEVPKEYAEFLEPTGKGGQVFQAMWKLLDLEKLMKGQGPI